MEQNKFRIKRPVFSDEGSDYEPSNPSQVWTIQERSKPKNLPKTRSANSLLKSKSETCGELETWRQQSSGNANVRKNKIFDEIPRSVTTHKHQTSPSAPNMARTTLDIAEPTRPDLFGLSLPNRRPTTDP